MPIRVIHGNGDLLGAAAQGVGEGFQAFTDARNKDRVLDDREKRTRVFDERVQSETARLESELAMDQEVHAAKMQEFNRRMFDREALSNWQRNAAQYDGPNKFAVQREALADTVMDPELKAQQMALIDAEENAEMRDRAALGYRARIGELLRQNPELAEQSLVAQQLADPAAMEGIAPEELPGALNDLEQDFRLLRQQQRDDLAFAEAGQRLSKLSTDPGLGYAMQEQIPRIIESMADKYPPQAMNNLLAGLGGEVPMSSLMDGGATEAAAREFLRTRQQEQFAQTPEGRAAIAEQARQDALGAGVSDPGGPPANPRTFLEEVAARREAGAKEREEIESRRGQLEQRLSSKNLWDYRAPGKKRAALVGLRRAIGENPEVVQDEAAYRALLEKHGIDPDDPSAAEAAANAATMLQEDFDRYEEQIPDGAALKRQDREALRDLERFYKATDEGPRSPFDAQGGRLLEGTQPSDEQRREILKLLQQGA